MKIIPMDKDTSFVSYAYGFHNPQKANQVYDDELNASVIELTYMTANDTQYYPEDHRNGVRLCDLDFTHILTKTKSKEHDYLKESIFKFGMLKNSIPSLVIHATQLDPGEYYKFYLMEYLDKYNLTIIITDENGEKVLSETLPLSKARLLRSDIFKDYGIKLKHLKQLSENNRVLFVKRGYYERMFFKKRRGGCCLILSDCEITTTSWKFPELTGKLSRYFPFIRKE